MPTYVYKFVETGETIEVQQSFSDPTLTEYTHPDTGRTMSVKKVFQPVGVTFKGDGFYKTDSRASKSGPTTSSSSDSSSTTSSTDAGSSSSSSSDAGTTSSGTSGSSSTSDG